MNHSEKAGERPGTGQGGDVNAVFPAVADPLGCAAGR